jgi:gliding motility-associated-like protein
LQYSPPVSIEFSDDVFFAPNVFTPNGDVHNEGFTIETTYEVTALKIVNLYGKEILSSSAGVWDGANAPTGVYYWILNYADCFQREETAKGWVHLIR